MDFQEAVDLYVNIVKRFEEVKGRKGVSRVQ